jgi:putative transcriptional regulator
VRNDLKPLREERGWSQGALAERLGVSRQTVNALETGRYDPSLPLAFAIARLFERSIEEIFFPEDCGPSSTSSWARGSRLHGGEGEAVLRGRIGGAPPS